jgi:hypothetical protein
MRVPQIYYDRASLMHDTVFEICERLRNLKKCKNCPHAQFDKRSGQTVSMGCRMMAEETIAVVLEAADANQFHTKAP